MKTLNAVADKRSEPRAREMADLRNSLEVLGELASHLAERVELLEAREALHRPFPPELQAKLEA